MPFGSSLNINNFLYKYHQHIWVISNQVYLTEKNRVIKLRKPTTTYKPVSTRGDRIQSKKVLYQMGNLLYSEPNESVKSRVINKASKKKQVLYPAWSVDMHNIREQCKNTLFIEVCSIIFVWIVLGQIFVFTRCEIKVVLRSAIYEIFCYKQLDILPF